jgi:hypothetical protein
MRSDSLKFRIPVYEVLIISLVTVVPISLAGLYSLSQSHRSLRETIGNDFSAIAGSTAAEVSQFIRERVTEVGRLAAEPPLIDAIASANKAYAGMDDAAIAARIDRIDKAWNTVPVDPVINQILASRVSVWLRTFRELDPRVLRITVTDDKGATVAVTHKPMGYIQVAEENWQNIFAGGKGAVSLTDIRYDPVTNADYIGIGWPVFEEGSNQLIGTVDALVDISALSSIGNRTPIPGARILLVKDDGTVIAGPQVRLAKKLKSDEYAAVRDAVGALAARQTGYIAAPFSNGRSQLIGFADTGLKQDYRNLGWVVMVCQDTTQAFMAVSFVSRLIALVSITGLAMVTLLVVYFALHRKQPLTEIGELAHEPAASSGFEAGASPDEEGSEAENNA